MADYNVNMKQWNGTSFDNVLPLAFNSMALEGKSYDDIIQYAQSLLGTGGENCRIAWGSYTGDGKYGASHPNSIACDFTPVLLAIHHATSDTLTPVLAFRDMPSFGFSSSGGINAITWGERGVSWYVTSSNTMSINYQMNASGKTYYYLILGYSV